MTPLYLLLSLFLGVLSLVAAYPEVIPGPGLPSLQSLNITSEQLYKIPFKPIGTPASQDSSTTFKANPLALHRFRKL